MVKGINGLWTNAARWRCHGKKRYRSFEQATNAAERRSNATGDLIISYQCPDCSFFHIGHADRSQILARMQNAEIPRKLSSIDLPFAAIAIAEAALARQSIPSTSSLLCPVCGEAISEDRIQNASSAGNVVRYCTPGCAPIAKRRRGSRRSDNRGASLCIGEMK
jgi:hypothetical protein